MFSTGRSRTEESVTDTSLSSFRKEIREFVLAVVRQEYDLLLLRARKGIGLFKLATQGREPFWFKTGLSNRIAFLPSEKLRNARILLFDDALRTGEQIEDEMENLAKLGAVRNQLNLAIFLVCDKAPQEFWPEYRYDKYFLVSDNEYTRWTTELLTLFSRSGVPLDVDHLEFKLPVSAADHQRLLDAVLSFSSAHEAKVAEEMLPPSLLSGGSVNIVGADFFRSHEFGLPEVFKEEGVMKVRFHISPRAITFVPMGFFAVPEAATIEDVRSECRKSALMFRFCESPPANGVLSTLRVLNKPQIRNPDIRLCLERVQFNFSLIMGRKFLSQFAYHARDNGLAFGEVYFDLAHAWLLYPCLWTDVVGVVRRWLDMVRQELGAV